MSDFQAIGGVSATLQTLLKDRMELPPDVQTVKITVSTPRARENEPVSEDPRLNLFLYRVTENSSLKNQEIPGHGHPGTYGQPPLSLDLHYLITAYGSKADGDLANEMLAHYVLGSAMRVLHDYPVITDKLATTKAGAAKQTILDKSLIGEFEQVKLCLQPLSLEDLSKVWTALTIPYRLSIAYMVSVIQIESQRERRYPRPVGEPPAAGPRLHVVTFRSPQIQAIGVYRADDQKKQERPYPYVRIGDTLMIRGLNLAGETTRVVIGNVSLGVAQPHDDHVEIVVPDDSTLQPGPQPLMVVHDVIVRNPPEPSAGFQSNQAIFMLVPHIKELDSSTPGQLIIKGSRLFAKGMECLALLGDTVIHSDNYTSKDSTEIAFNLPNLAAGNYAVRVRVNGAESIDQRILNIP